VIDILVNATTPELSEAFGTTILEGMACGKLVVASRTGGTPELIDDGVNGLLFAPGDVDALTATLKNAVDNFHDLERLRAGAMEKISTVYPSSRVTDTYKRIVTDDRN
jgi:glycosyltransferase involved in cell wall biosynthesis